MEKKFLNNGEYKNIMIVLWNMNIIVIVLPKLWLWANKVEFHIKNMNIIF